MLQKVRGYTDIAREDERIREPARTEQAMEAMEIELGEDEQKRADAAEFKELRAILHRLSQHSAEGTETFKFFDAEHKDGYSDWQE